MKVITALCLAVGVSSAALAQSLLAPRASNAVLEKELKRIVHLVESDAINSGQAELKLLALRDRFDAPCERGAIYAAISRLPYRNQPLSKEIRHVYRRLAMAQPIDPLTRAQMYRSGAALPWDLIDWQDFTPAKQERVRARVARAYLEGLWWMLEQGVPGRQHALPMVPMLDYVYFDDHKPDDLLEAEEQRDALIKRRETLRYRNQLVIQRWLLAHQIISLYRENGNAYNLDELERLARNVLGPDHRQAVRELLAAAKASRPLFRLRGLDE